MTKEKYDAELYDLIGQIKKLKNETIDPDPGRDEDGIELKIGDKIKIFDRGPFTIEGFGGINKILLEGDHGYYFGFPSLGVKLYVEKWLDSNGEELKIGDKFTVTPSDNIYTISKLEKGRSTGKMYVTDGVWSATANECTKYVMKWLDKNGVELKVGDQFKYYNSVHNYTISSLTKSVFDHAPLVVCNGNHFPARDCTKHIPPVKHYDQYGKEVKIGDSICIYDNVNKTIESFIEGKPQLFNAVEGNHYLISELVDKPDLPLNRAPKERENYWFICSAGEICSRLWTEGSIICKDHLSMGNVYKDLASAESDAATFKLYIQMQDFADTDPDKKPGTSVQLYYNEANDKFEVARMIYPLHPVYFKSAERAAKALEKFKDSLHLLK